MRSFMYNELECCEINGMYGIGCYEDYIESFLEIDSLVSLIEFDELMYELSSSDPECFGVVKRGDVVSYIRKEKLDQLKKISK